MYYRVPVRVGIINAGNAFLKVVHVDVLVATTVATWTCTITCTCKLVTINS